MTLGDGIFYSTLLLVLAAAIYQVSIRQKWNLVGKIVGSLALLGAVSGGAYWLWDSHQSRAREVTELAGVRLGMTPVDVTLKLGKPIRQIRGDEDDAFTEAFFFGETEQAIDMFVLFSGETPTADRVCVLRQDLADPPNLLSFGLRESEERIIEKLGPPTSVSVHEAGLSKLISYDPFNVVYEINQGKVDRLCITSRPDMRFSDEYRPRFVPDAPTSEDAPTSRESE
jgi:hypothetical protein